MTSKNLLLDTEQLMTIFGLKRNHGCAILERLLNVSDQAYQTELAMLEPHRLKLLREGGFWNEEELKMQFLAFLFYHTDINEVNKQFFPIINNFTFRILHFTFPLSRFYQ